MKRCRQASCRKRLTAAVMGGALLMGSSGCELGDFTTTTTTTLSAEEVVTYLIRSFILTPIDEFVTDRIEDAFGDEDE